MARQPKCCQMSDPMYSGRNHPGMIRNGTVSMPIRPSTVFTRPFSELNMELISPTTTTIDTKCGM